MSVRRLIHIPVIHSQADMGSLRLAIQALTVKKQGAQGWARNVNVIEGLWVKIEEAIACWSLPYEKMRLYQDGLPVCGRELEIVSEAAGWIVNEAGSGPVLEMVRGKVVVAPAVRFTVTGVGSALVQAEVGARSRRVTLSLTTETLF